MAGGPAPASALGAPDDADRALLVEPQQLAEAQVEAGGDRLATASVGLVSPRSTCESIGGSRRCARRGRAGTGPSPRAGRGRGVRSGSGARGRRRPYGGAYVITYKRLMGSVCIGFVCADIFALFTALLRPDVLVLAGGGTVGEAWMHGVLAGLEDAAGVNYTRTGRRSSAPRAGWSARPAGPRAAGEAARKMRIGSLQLWCEDGGGAADGDFGHPRAQGVDGRAEAWSAGYDFVARAVANALAGAVKPAGALARAAVLSSKAAPHGQPLHPAARADRALGRALRRAAAGLRGRPADRQARGPRRAGRAGSGLSPRGLRVVRDPLGVRARGDRRSGAYVDGGAWSVTNLDAARNRSWHPSAMPRPDRRPRRPRPPHGLDPLGPFRVASGLEIARAAPPGRGRRAHRT